MEKICKGGPLQNFQPTLEDELKLYFFRVLNPDICGYTLGMFIFHIEDITFSPIFKFLGTNFLLYARC